MANLFQPSDADEDPWENDVPPSFQSTRRESHATRKASIPRLITPRLASRLGKRVSVPFVLSPRSVNSSPMTATTASPTSETAALSPVSGVDAKPAEHNEGGLPHWKGISPRIKKAFVFWKKESGE